MFVIYKIDLDLQLHTFPLLAKQLNANFPPPKDIQATSTISREVGTAHLCSFDRTFDVCDKQQNTCKFYWENECAS